MIAGRVSGWIVAVVAVFVAGCGPHETRQQITQLHAGRQAFDEQRYTEAVDQLSRVIDAAEPDATTLSEALYVRGMAHAQAGQRAEAYRDLVRCVATTHSTDIAWRAYVVLGTLHFEDEQWADAMVAFRAAADRMPNRPPKDLVLFRLGLCYERIGQWRNARTAYAELVRRFPDGTYGDAARRKLNRNADYFAIQAGVFSVERNAEQQVRRLREHNLPATMRREIHNRLPRNVVLVGRYATYEEARRQLGVVRQYVPDAVLWP